MKKYIIPVILLIASIGAFYYVNTLVNITNYNKLESDRDLIYTIKGTRTILYEALLNEEKNWGKSDGDKKTQIYFKYAKTNIDEIANNLKEREEDVFNLKTSLLVNDLYELYNLKDLVGHDQQTFKNKLENIYERSKKHEEELEKVIK